ncbi:MAG: hypothetical protein LBJ74_06000 [Heliobacteriaceae bacterium]|jgi:hypothetical protein|nr:hypothetical protein [Heliobacteriaceae bacterium]
MGLDNWIYGLNHLNAGLGGVNNYMDAKRDGATNDEALFSGSSIWALNAGRVETAQAMGRDYGPGAALMGHTINNLAGWSTPQSNMMGYTGLFGVGMMNQMMSGGMGFGMPMYSMGMMGMGNPFGMGGMCGGSMFGMSGMGMYGMGNPFGMGGMCGGSMFGMSSMGMSPFGCGSFGNPFMMNPFGGGFFC